MLLITGIYIVQTYEFDNDIKKSNNELVSPFMHPRVLISTYFALGTLHIDIPNEGLKCSQFPGQIYK